MSTCMRYRPIIKDHRRSLFAYPPRSGPPMTHNARMRRHLWSGRRTAVDPYCEDPIWSPTTDDEVMRKTLEILERRNIIGVTSGPLVDRYRSA